jgi:hypothetical protein
MWNVEMRNKNQRRCLQVARTQMTSMREILLQKREQKTSYHKENFHQIAYTRLTITIARSLPRR